MFKFIEKLKCKLRICCQTNIQCGEEAMREQLEKEKKEYEITERNYKNISNI